MAGVLQHRACALVVVLTLALAPAWTVGPAGSRCHCPPQCPMHAQGMTCHHASGMGCHSARSAAGIYSGCDHGHDRSVPASTIRGILPVSGAARPAEVRSILPRVRMRV